MLSSRAYFGVTTAGFPVADTCDIICKHRDSSAIGISRQIMLQCARRSSVHACCNAGVQLLTSAMRTWSQQLLAVQAVSNSMPMSATCSQQMAPSSNAADTWLQISPGSLSRMQSTAASARPPGQGDQQVAAGLAQCSRSSLQHLLACSVPPLTTRTWG